MHPHIDWTISVWNIVSWLLAGAGAAFAAGKAHTLLQVLVEEFREFREKFEKHTEEDQTNFDQIRHEVADVRVSVATLSRPQKTTQ